MITERKKYDIRIYKTKKHSKKLKEEVKPFKSEDRKTPPFKQSNRAFTFIIPKSLSLQLNDAENNGNYFSYVSNSFEYFLYQNVFRRCRKYSFTVPKSFNSISKKDPTKTIKTLSYENKNTVMYLAVQSFLLGKYYYRKTFRAQMAWLLLRSNINISDMLLKPLSYHEKLQKNSRKKLIKPLSDYKKEEGNAYE